MRNLQRILRYDFVVGGSEVLARLVAYCIAVCAALASFVGQFLLLGGDTSEMTAVNALAYLYEGSPALGITQGISFMLPIVWLTLQVLACFVVISYSRKALECDAVGIVGRVGRRRWWLSKCLWTIAGITLCFAATLLLSIIVVLACGGSLGGFAPEGSFFLYGIESVGSGVRDGIVWQNFLVCYASTVLLALTGVLLSLQFDVRYAFAAVVVLVVLSIYSDGVLLFPQFGMLVRGEPYNLNALSLVFEVGFCVTASLAVVGVGLALVRRRDWLTHDR